MTAAKSRTKHGLNAYRPNQHPGLSVTLPGVMSEPVVVLLFCLTLASSALHEVIPVAFNSFVVLGMVRLEVLIKHLQTFECLGSATGTSHSAYT